MQGWIKLHRQIVEWEWYTDANTFRVFMHLLLNANHKEKRYKGILIKKGQLLTGRKSLALALDLSERQVRTALTKLKKSGEIDQEKARKTTKSGSIITICNYASYQSEKTKSDQHNDQHNDQEATSKRPRSDQEATTNKNDKNIKNEKNVKNFLNEQKKSEKQPSQIENELREFINNNSGVKRRLFSEIEKGCGKTLSVDEKKAIAARVTVFCNDYALRDNWDSNESNEKKLIRLTNYIINSVNNGFELVKTKVNYAKSNEPKGYQISDNFKQLLDEMAASKESYGF